MPNTYVYIRMKPNGQEFDGEALLGEIFGKISDIYSGKTGYSSNVRSINSGHIGSLCIMDADPKDVKDKTSEIKKDYSKVIEEWKITS
jgi:hypothetical protein